MIDSGTVHHMTSNSNIFSSFRPHKLTFPITIADVSNYNIVGSGTTKLTSSMTLSSVLSLLNLFSIWFLWVFTKNLNCRVIFFSNHCVIQDLMKKQIISKANISYGFYILNTWVSWSIVCSNVISPFEVHYQLRHLSLPTLKKICSQFHDIPSLDCESCRSAKHHRRRPSGLRVNRWAKSTFELVHFDV